MRKLASLIAVPLLFIPVGAFADVPPWRDYWGEIKKSYPAPEDWELHVVDDSQRWTMFRMDVKNDVLSVSLGGKATHPFEDAFNETGSGDEDLRIFVQFEGYEEMETEIVSWELGEYVLEFGLEDFKPLFQSARSVTARRVNPDHSVTFTLKGSRFGLDQLEHCHVFEGLKRDLAAPQ